MHRRLSCFVFVVFSLALLGVGGWILAHRTTSRPEVAETPSATATETVTATIPPSATLTVTPSSTPTTTLTATLTATPSPSATATLATLVVRRTAVNPDVTLDALAPVVSLPSRTPTPLPTVNVPTPAARLSTVPAGTAAVGWYRYDVADPALRYEGAWKTFTGSWHSLYGYYVYTDDPTARLTLRFLGAAVRLRYVKFSTYGVFQVRLDGAVVTTIDAYQPSTPKQTGGEFVTTAVFRLAHGWHTLEVLHLGRQNPASQGQYIALDGIDVYLNGPAPTSPPVVAASTVTGTPTFAPAQRIEVLVAPPPLLPTATPRPLENTAVSLSVGCDNNRNGTLDAGEGVQGLPVYLVAADTNQVVASGLTDDQGYVRLETTASPRLRLVVPYLNRFWSVSGAQTAITLLIPAVNQPALIP